MEHDEMMALVERACGAENQCVRLVTTMSWANQRLKILIDMLGRPRNQNWLEKELRELREGLLRALSREGELEVE